MSLISAVLLTASAGTAQPGAASAPAATPTAPPAPSAGSAAPVAPLSQGSIGFLTAGDLAERCERQSVTDTNYCFAYIAGVHDTIQAYEKWLSTREFCPPEPLSHSDLRRTFLTYVKAYPSASNGMAASVIVVAVKQTYPC